MAGSSRSGSLNDGLWLTRETGTLPRMLGEAGRLPPVHLVSKSKKGALPSRWHL